jgi:hypothetical protein
MIKPSYTSRILELHKKNNINKEIRDIIYNEYGIRMTLDNIEKKLTINSIKNNSQINNQKKETNRSIISSAIAMHNAPLSSKDLSKLILKKFNLRLSKREINAIIFRSMRNEIAYNNDTYQYSIVKKTTINSTKEEKSEFDCFLQNAKEDELLQIVEMFFKNKYIDVATGNKEVDYLIKTIVKDNIITDCEELFLKNKTKEYNLPENIIDKAKEHLEQNNPYLDNIIHIIFDDGIISDNELLFLNEKTIENNFTEKFVNNRFWMIAFSDYSTHLLKIPLVEDLMKLIFLYNKLGLTNESNDSKLISALNIFSDKSIMNVIKNAEEKIRLFLIQLLKESNKIENSVLFINEAISKLQVTKKLEVITKISNESNSEIFKLIKILNQEKIRLGSPDVNLLVENVKYRIENELWD